MKVKGRATIFLGWIRVADRLGRGSGGRQIASCEFDSLRVDAVGAIRAAICARVLAGGLLASLSGGRLLVGAGD
jgi:hypothetical protein